MATRETTASNNVTTFGTPLATVTLNAHDPTPDGGEAGILDQETARQWAAQSRPIDRSTADRLRALNEHGYGIVGYPNHEHDTTQYYPVRGIQPDKQPWEQDTKAWRPVCDHKHLGDQGRDEAFDCAERDLKAR